MGIFVGHRFLNLWFIKMPNKQISGFLAEWMSIGKKRGPPKRERCLIIIKFDHLRGPVGLNKIIHLPWVAPRVISWF